MQPPFSQGSTGAALRDITRRLESKGIDSPRLSAELITAHALRISRLELLLQLAAPLSGQELEAIEELARRRERGEPVAYILGKKEFYGRELEVGPGSLIPRPETELIVDLVKEIYPAAGRFVFADIGTGCGNLAVALAAEFPNSKGLALDLSPGALALARLNIRRHGQQNRVLPVRMDLAEGVGRAGLDLLVANPPYLSQPELDSAGIEVGGYEPRMALVGGERGDELQLRLLDACAATLCSGGRLFMECSEKRTASLARIAGDRPGVWADAAVYRDLSGLDRVLALRKV
jgi:release factor glutamine methyltransferase